MAGKSTPWQALANGTPTAGYVDVILPGARQVMSKQSVDPAPLPLSPSLAVLSLFRNLSPVLLINNFWRGD